MEALAAEAEALTSLEAQLRAELRGARAQREAAAATLEGRAKELAEGKRRETELQREAKALTAEVADVEKEFGELQKTFAAQRIARAWYMSRVPTTTFADVAVRASPDRWASVFSSQGASASLASALKNDGARLRLLEKLWASFDNTAAILAGADGIPGLEAVRKGVEAAGFKDPSNDELSEVSNALKSDLSRLRWDAEQLQARRTKLSETALSSGRGSLDSSSPSLMVPRSPSLSSSLLAASAVVTPGKTPASRDFARALTVSRAANRLTGGLGTGGGTPVRASAATVYASIVPALNQLKARGKGGIALRVAGAKALAQAALDPQTREAILRADGASVLRAAVAEEQVSPAVELLRLEVDIALERLGQGGDG